MGWLFAVGIGMQENRRRAVYKALIPLAIGHAIAITSVIVVVQIIQVMVPQNTLRVGAAILLFGFGVWKLLRSSHPRWVGMKVSFIDLVIWSFLTASGHGAGLMLLPIVFTWGPVAQGRGQSMAIYLPADRAAGLVNLRAMLLPAAIHTSAYLLVTALAAVLVYEELGLRFLHKAWFNIDILWAIALVVSGVLTLLV